MSAMPGSKTFFCSCSISSLGLAHSPMAGSIDFAGPFLGSNFLLLIDSHSKWPEIYSVTSTAVSKTIEILRTIFAVYGIPEQVVTDNDSQFTSKEFAKFINGNGIHHICTPPYHPFSNGAMKRLVQSFKSPFVQVK